MCLCIGECEIDNIAPGHIESPFYNLILNSPYQYNQQMCIVQCLQQKAIKMCNCSVPNFLSIYNKSCQNDAQWKCAYDAFYGDSNVTLNILACIQYCPLECNSTL